MGRDEDKLIRQLSLLSFLLSRPRPFTAREVQESVEGYAEMSDETFARRFSGDRSDLAKIGIEIRVVSGADAAASAETQLYHLREEDFRLPGVEFTPAETRALCLALAALDGRFAYARPLRLALTAILRGHRDPMWDGLEQLPVALAPDEDAWRAGRQLSRMEEALARGKTVCFYYPSKTGALEERRFDPYNLFLIQGRWYAVGYDHERDGIRTFRLGRIHGTVRFLTEKTRDFSVPAGYDPEQYRARPPWSIGRVKGQASIRVADDLAWWVKRLEPHVSWLGADDDGCGLFAVPYADETVLLSWVVGLGGCGELLEPQELRERLHGLLTQVCRDHEGVADGPQATEFPAMARPSAPEDTTAPIAPEHLARAMTLLYYLLDEQCPALVTWQDLETDLGLARAEVEADLSLINLVNFGGGTYALRAEAGPEGVQVEPDVMAGTFSRPARLSPVMARALCLALDLLGNAFALDGLDSLASVREKVRALIGAGAPESAVVVEDVMAPDPMIVGVLNHAIRDNRVVALAYYTTARQELNERLVEPYLLFHSPDGWYLEAYCLKADDQRTFKLERIRSARATDDRFIPRPEVDLTRRRTGQAFSPADAAVWATVRFRSRWRGYLEDRLAECSVRPDGDLQVRMPYLDERWMAQEIIRYLGDAVLEQPASARGQVAQLAGVLAARYGEALPDSHAHGPAGDDR
ncbi:MAG: WYL domain-containing protein [Thermoleophilia bacterium]|nr:WYL domain-containing protein [Thermoleophilia bacterium]